MTHILAQEKAIQVSELIEERYSNYEFNLIPEAINSDRFQKSIWIILPPVELKSPY